MSTSAQPPRLMDRVRGAIRARHYSRRTEDSYAGWIRRFIFFHGKKHPAAMGAEEVNAFLTNLAVARKVSASTQGQALSALVSSTATSWMIPFRGSTRS
ncbi:MAG: phage integrase N-terminal SAM-like domain-containing protein [Acidobacteria bacterium]|nr:phage integrase N-terminal SAM-like domain-containing protein [Acidobacteriota bacterium]